MSKTNAESSKQDTIQDIAFKIAEQQLNAFNLENGPRERTIFVLGSKGVGKTTVINAFFDREENPKPTLALEYSFGRKTGHSQKHILHVWELGSLEKSEQLLQVPLKSNSIANLSCIIMLDLSQPHRVWTDLKSAYEALRQFSDNLGASSAEIDLCYEKAKERVKKDHVDLQTLDLMPFPVVIVGGKYDLFMACEPEIKKHICRCLRATAHLLGGSLLFFSSKIQKLAKTLRDTISHLGFGSPSNPFRVHTTDYNDALSIWFGTDSWDNIGPFGIQSLPSIEANLIAEIPQEQISEGKQHLQDPAKDQGFREGIIDEMRAQKDEELRTIVKDVQMRRQFESVAT